MSQQKHTAEFESCVEQVMEQGHDKGSAFAICTESFKKAGKPIFIGESENQKLHLFCESFKLEGNRVSGVAIHPRRIFHPEEDIEHVYLREELMKAAPTGAGKPFGIDHIYVLPPPNLLTKSWYCPDEDGICFEGLVDDYIAEQIRQKKFKGISIELNWLRPGGSVEYVNGVAARNFELTSVHFLKQFPPGDPDAYVKLWEQIKEQLVVGPPLPLDQRVEALEQQLQGLLNQINVINAKLEVLTGTSSSPSATAQPAQPGASQTIGVMKMKEQNQNQEPEKDEHGCIVGKEKWNPETEKCVPIETPAQESMKEQPEVEQCVLDGIGLGLSNVEIAEKCNVSLITVQEIRGGFVGLYEALKKLREQQGASPGKPPAERAKQHFNISDEDWDKLSDEEKQAYIDKLPPPGTKLKEQGNQEPEKDEYGCLIGKERYDEEQDKCVPITAEARVAFLETKMRLKEQEGELSIEEIKAKIAELAKQREELDKKLWPEPPESGLSEEEKAAIRTQIDVLWAEIDAYEQALKIKIAGQAAPPQTPPETELKQIRETIVALRKKLVETEAKLVNIEKQKKREAATWKEKYETLREAVKGAIPPPRIWKSWTPGPQRYVQENLKILREIES